VLGVFEILSSAFQPAVVALMANVFVGRNLLLVAEHIEGTDKLSITAPIARVIGAIATGVCFVYALWVAVCLTGFLGSGAVWYAFVFLPVPACLAAVFYLVTWALRKLLSVKMEKTFRRPTLECEMYDCTIKVSGCKMKDSTIKVSFKNELAMFKYKSDNKENPIPKAIAVALLLSPLVIFGNLLALNVFGGLTTVGDTGPTIQVCYAAIFRVFGPPHTFSVPDLDLSKLLELDFPSMAWDLEQFIDETAAIFSLTTVAAVLRTVLTYTGHVAYFLGEDPVSKPQGMADGRNALQGVDIMVLLNPLNNKAALILEDADGGIEMVGVEGAEDAQKDVKVDAVKEKEARKKEEARKKKETEEEEAREKEEEEARKKKEANDKGLKYPLQKHTGKHVSNQAVRCCAEVAALVCARTEAASSLICCCHRHRHRRRR
jgi:hypothetical protein